MKKITSTIIVIMLSRSCFAQSEMIEVAFYPLYDSMGEATYIKKSAAESYRTQIRTLRFIASI